MGFYQSLTYLASPIIDMILKRRVASGKADSLREGEYRGIAGRERPLGKLVWVHAASVGEAQSALALIDLILDRYQDAHVLMTSGTLTSARLMAQKLPPRAFHQFAPLDRTDWVERFLEHWQPDYALWMESELWPNMLSALKKRGVPAALVNARMSVRSAKNWRLLRGFALQILSCFEIIFAQTDEGAQAYRGLGALDVRMTGNIKYSADPLAYDSQALQDLKDAIGGRPVWLYASTHAGEEALACRVHAQVKESNPDVLTVIVPRHPERRAEIMAECHTAGLLPRLRGDALDLPQAQDDIYIADTLGELGVFYRLAPLAVIGRSFSDDGGGGHNPLEAAQLGAAVVSGVNIRYQRALYGDMEAAGAVLMVDRAEFLPSVIQDLLNNENRLKSLRDKGAEFVTAKRGILGAMADQLWPLMDRSFVSKDYRSLKR